MKLVQLNINNNIVYPNETIFLRIHGETKKLVYLGTDGKYLYFSDGSLKKQMFFDLVKNGSIQFLGKNNDEFFSNYRGIERYNPYLLKLFLQTKGLIVSKKSKEFGNPNWSLTVKANDGTLWLLDKMANMEGVYVFYLGRGFYLLEGVCNPEIVLERLKVKDNVQDETN